ncbi:MAG: ABC transporter ATP-binding protein [Haloechinothrix sp.]
MSLLRFTHVTLELDGADIHRPILCDVSLHVDRGEVVGLVGESGSGKSTTARAALGAVPRSGRLTGSVQVAGQDVFSLPERALRHLRGQQVGMVFQDPRGSLNPLRRIGDFMVEGLRANLGLDARAARDRVLPIAASVGLPQPERLLAMYPHQLSGGMLQRVVIATALAAGPELLLADEATSALDVTTQAETLAVLSDAQRERGLGMLFITHDLHLAAGFCDRVCVMYAGRIVEERRGPELFTAARHPYTTALLASAPEIQQARRLHVIPGHPPSLSERLPGCPFAPRCGHAEPACQTWTPSLYPDEVGAGAAACRRLDQVTSPLLRQGESV